VKANIKPHSLCELECDEPISDLLKAEGYPITSFFYTDYWDLEHYNPIYASEEGSVESPMAGLHFTDRLIDRLKSKGVDVAFITLHVVGSWLPFLENETQGHEAQSEDYFVPDETARLIGTALQTGHRIVAVGSTTMRTLETSAIRKGALKSGAGKSRLFIEPGHKFKLVHSYFTNFHPARSSLMVLDAAFCPAHLLLRAYREARRKHYLFHEFGDAILYI
jgi:S-adenosylmethionine:tRNA ribosyltransferase-isomerase